MMEVVPAHTTSVEVLQAAELRDMWADPVRQGDSSAEGCHSIYRKQLRSVGIDPWPLADTARAPSTPAEKRQPYHVYLMSLPMPDVLTIWGVTTDGGPDQKKIRKQIKEDLKYHRAHLVVDADCLQHANQLVVKSGLLTLDRWLTRYGAPWATFLFYSSVAKTVHVWRDLHRKIYATWVALFGPETANKFARSLVPRCLSGRWGSISGTLKRILAGNRTMLVAVIVYALTHRILVGVNLRTTAIQTKTGRQTLHRIMVGSVPFR